MAVILFHFVNFRITTFYLIIVQITCIARNAIIVAHINCTSHFFTCYERLIEFLSVARSNHLHFSLTILWINLGISLFQGFCQHIQCYCGCLLHKQVTVLTMLKCIDYQINGIVECHHETSHLRVCYRNWFTLLHLIYPKRNNRASAGHYVAITGAANGGLSVITQLARFCYCHFFHHSLGDTHCINRIGGLICRKNDNVLYSMRNS